MTTYIFSTATTNILPSRFPFLVRTRSRSFASLATTGLDLSAGSGFTTSSSPGQPMFLLFRTDSINGSQGLGWELTYYTSDEGPVCNDEEFQCNAGGCIPQEWGCDGSRDCIDSSDEAFGCTVPERQCTRVTVSRGTLTDGQGPYENNVDECYEIVPELFEASRGDSLWLRFSYFDLEPNFDYVFVYNGVGADKVLLGALDGEYGHQASVRLDAFESEDGKFLIEFITDFSNAHEGWTLVFWVGREEDYCPRYTLGGNSSIAGPSASSDCVFPFRHDDVLYYDCADTLAPGVSDGPTRQWCATEVGMHGVVSNNSWGYCNLCRVCEARETTDDVPQRCEFPFSYEGRMYHDCATAGDDGVEWCATETNSEFVATAVSNCSPCVAPVIGARGNETDSEPDTEEACGRLTTSKAACVFPFVYMGQTFEDCTWNVTGLDGGLCAVEVDNRSMAVGELEECTEECVAMLTSAAPQLPPSSKAAFSVASWLVVLSVLR